MEKQQQHKFIIRYSSFSAGSPHFVHLCSFHFAIRFGCIGFMALALSKIEENKSDIENIATRVCARVYGSFQSGQK